MFTSQAIFNCGVINTNTFNDTKIMKDFLGKSENFSILWEKFQYLIDHEPEGESSSTNCLLGISFKWFYS